MVRTLLMDATAADRAAQYHHFFGVANVLRKALWFAGAGGLLLVVLASVLGNAELMLAGAVGGFLSLLYRMLRSDGVPGQYWSYWGPLALGPIAGALAGYAGLLLIDLMKSLEVVGTAFNAISWEASREPTSLAVAFLLGFSARLLDRMVTQAEGSITSEKTAVSGGYSLHPSTTEGDAGSMAPRLSGNDQEASHQYRRAAALVLTDDSRLRAGDVTESDTTSGDSKATSAERDTTPEGAKAANPEVTVDNQRGGD